MQLGHDSNHRRTLPGPRLSDRALRFGDLNQKEDPRSSQLNLRISGESSLMRSLKTLILRAADCNSTVLITGESGTGKELIARSIHDFGQRQREPFLAINCGALTESLLESELFGHVKVLSPARLLTRKACLSQRVREPSFWMSLEKCHHRCRCAYYACSRNTKFAL